jgi:hypothetical protein
MEEPPMEWEEKLARGIAPTAIDDVPHRFRNLTMEGAIEAMLREAREDYEAAALRWRLVRTSLGRCYVGECEREVTIGCTRCFAHERAAQRAPRTRSNLSRTASHEPEDRASEKRFT